MRTYLARGGERGRCNDGCVLLVLRGFAAGRHPRETMRIKNGQNDVADARGLCGGNAKSRRSQVGIGNGRKIIGRYRRRGEVAKSPLLVLAIEQVGDQLGVDRLRGNGGELVNQLRKDGGELVKKSVVEVERFVKALIPKCDRRGPSVV
jgi:hypothetical protein